MVDSMARSAGGVLAGWACWFLAGRVCSVGLQLIPIYYAIHYSKSSSSNRHVFTGNIFIIIVIGVESQILVNFWGYIQASKIYPQNFFNFSNTRVVYTNCTAMWSHSLTVGNRGVWYLKLSS